MLLVESRSELAVAEYRQTIDPYSRKVEHILMSQSGIRWGICVDWFSFSYQPRPNISDRRAVDSFFDSIGSRQRIDRKPNDPIADVHHKVVDFLEENWEFVIGIINNSQVERYARLPRFKEIELGTCPESGRNFGRADLLGVNPQRGLTYVEVSGSGQKKARQIEKHRQGINLLLDEPIPSELLLASYSRQEDRFRIKIKNFERNLLRG